MIIDITSDLHGFYPQLEGGDLLIVAGDLTIRDTHKEMFEFVRWTTRQKYRKLVFIAGNHDNCLVGNPSMHQKHNYDLEKPDIAYLIDNGIEFEYFIDSKPVHVPGYPTCDVHCVEKKAVKIWGSPWTKTFEGMNPYCKAFTVDTDEELAEKWKLIPDDIDILITHSPPYLKGDYIPSDKQHVGSESLYRRVGQLKNLKLHVFGHVHEGYGIYDETFVNASHVNERYQPVNKPVRIIL